MTYVRANETRGTGPSWDRFPASLPQIAYVVADGEFLCVVCANGGNGSEAKIGAETTEDPQWTIIGAQVNDDDTPCAHCGRIIPKGREA